MSEFHHVYVISHSRDGQPCKPVKIGISANAETRLRGLQTANPSRLILICTFNFPNQNMARMIEEAFHETMAAKRLSGEWFDMSPLMAVELMCTNVRQALTHFLSEDAELFEAACEGSNLNDNERHLAKIPRGPNNDNARSA